VKHLKALLLGFVLLCSISVTTFVSAQTVESVLILYTTFNKTEDQKVSYELNKTYTVWEAKIYNELEYNTTQDGARAIISFKSAESGSSEEIRIYMYKPTDYALTIVYIDPNGNSLTLYTGNWVKCNETGKEDIRITVTHQSVTIYVYNATTHTTSTAVVDNFPAPFSINKIEAWGKDTGSTAGDYATGGYVNVEFTSYLAGSLLDRIFEVLPQILTLVIVVCLIGAVLKKLDKL